MDSFNCISSQQHYKEATHAIKLKMQYQTSYPVLKEIRIKIFVKSICKLHC